MKEEFSTTRFVTVNIIKDWMNSLKDIFGYEQKTYNQIVNDTVKEMLKEETKGYNILWFRQTIDRTFDKTLQITIYGQKEKV